MTARKRMGRGIAVPRLEVDPTTLAGTPAGNPGQLAPVTDQGVSRVFVRNTAGVLVPTTAVALRSDVIMTVDPSSGTSPPAGTVITNQDEYDALGYDLLYPQDALDILPRIVAHEVVIECAAGTYLAKPGSGGYGGALSVGLCVHDFAQNARELLYAGISYQGKPIIRFVGSDYDTIEAAQAGTSTTYTLTRSAGTWTTDEHKGKFVRITSGAGAGSVRPIAGNTASILTITTGFVSTGTCTFEIVRPAAVFLASTNGTSVDALYGIARPIAGHANTVTLQFENIAFGSAALPYKDIRGEGMLYTFSECEFYTDSGYTFFRTGAAQGLFSYLGAVECIVHLLSGASGCSQAAGAVGQQFYRGLLVEGAATYYFDLYRSSRETLVLKDVYIDATAGVAVYSLGGIIEFSDNARVEGNSAATGILIDGADPTVIQGASHSTLSNCAIAVDIRNSQRVAINAALSGAGNAKCWKITKASRLVVNSPASLAGTTEIDVDGTIYTYAADLPSVGSEIVGSLKSSMVRI